MFKLPLKSTHSVGRSPISFSTRGLKSSPASDRTMHVDRVVNELQAAEGTTNTICRRLANDRMTTRTEQLIWLARYSLDVSAAHNCNVDPDGKPAVDDQPKVAENEKQPTTCEAKDGPTLDLASVWAHLWLVSWTCPFCHVHANIMR